VLGNINDRPACLPFHLRPDSSTFHIWHTHTAMLTFAFAMLLTLAPQQEAGSPISGVKLEVEGDILRCTDNCVVDYEGMRFEAPWIAYNKTTGDVTAGDH